MALLSFSGSPYGGSLKLLPEWDKQPRITPTTILDHSIAGSALGAWQMFHDRSVLESHFIVRGQRSGAEDGHIWQLMTTDREADANLDANRFAISIETEDDGDPDTQPWTHAQLESLVWLHEKLRQVHPTIPCREVDSCAGGGLGFHTILGAPSCFTPVAKTCPGRARIDQWREVLLPAFLQPEEADMALSDADKTWIAAKLEESERRVARYVDHGTAETTGSDDHHERIRADLAQIAAQVRDLKAVVDGLALGRLEGDFDVTGLIHATAAPPPPPPP